MVDPTSRVIRVTDPRKLPPKVFTSTSTIGLLSVLTNNVKVQKRFGDSPSLITRQDIIAIWDTGASHTCITPKLAYDLNLGATGVRNIIGANSNKLCKTHIVSIQLPNEVIIEKIKVTELTFSGGDVLIGMDIIQMGDFAVSNFNGTTKFTFRIPSLGDFDFCKNAGLASNKVGRNEPCPCGSGKKYKKCHGR